MRKVISLSFALSGIILGNITEEQFFYQDYMDFGQNKGRYTAGSYGVTITRKNSTTPGDYNQASSITYDVIMPDFVSSVDWAGGNKSFLGGSYVGTAMHVLAAFVKKYWSPEYEYSFVDQVNNTNIDRSYARTNKFITSGDALDIIEVNKEKPLDTNRYTLFFRSGYGYMYYVTDRDKKGSVALLVSGAAGSAATGGILNYKGLTNDNKQKLQFVTAGVDGFSNFITTSDSGSPMFAWDTQEKKWVVVGFAQSASSTNYFIGSSSQYTLNRDATAYYVSHNQQELDKLKQLHINGSIKLDGRTINWDGSTLDTLTTAKEKDTYIYGGGTINLTTAVDSGSGGFYFQGERGTEYTVTGTYTNSKNQHVASQWKGGGISIDEGVVVNWDINGYRSSDGLFKVGKGTLRVTQQNISWLNLGEGEVILDPTTSQTTVNGGATFKHIVLVSGRATLKLAEGKSSALDTSKLNFSRLGGKLDINGNDITFDHINASDFGARIINTGSNATLTISNTSNTNIIYHGQIGNNINIKSTQDANKSIIFDGSIHGPDGTLMSSKGTLSFQGHPVIHAYVNSGFLSKSYYIKQKLQQDVFTSPTTFDQPDWEHRLFTFKEIKGEGGNITLGRDATLLGDLQLSNTIATFGGEAKIYIDGKDGENALKNGAAYSQALSSKANNKDDNFFFEGNVNLKSGSQFNVSNTDKNPIKFGNFLGIDKTSDDINNIKTKMLNYNLALDDTSSASIKYLDLYAANISTLSSTKDASTPSISPSNPSKGTITVENLNIHTGISRINGSGKLELKTNSTNSKIIFDNLDSILVLNNQNTLMLDSTTKITLNKISNVDNYKALKYNADYILIKSDEKISDNRSDKNINVISHNLADFIKIDSIHKDHEIGIKLVRTTPIDLNEASWMDKWLDKTITPSTSSTSTQLNNIKEAVGKYEDIFRALAQTNINGKKVYEDVYLDKIVDDAANGNKAALSKHLEDINNAIKSMDEYRSSTVESMLNSFSAYTYQKDARENILRQSGFNMRTSSLLKQILNTHLAQNEQDQTSDIKSDARPMDMIASLISSNKHHAWADAQGSFFGGEGKMAYAAGLSAGYDYYILNQKDKFLSLGLSLRYNFAGARAYDVQSQLQNLIGALHSQYITGHNEMLFNLYLGGSIARLTSSSRTSNDMSIRIDGYYKYRFDLTKGNNYYQAIKPVVGIGYSYVYLPQEIFNAFNNDDFIKIASINQNIPFIRAGAEYNLATQHSINAISLLATYNAISHFSRQVYIGTANPIGYDTTISPIWLELAFSGNYDLTDSFSLKYMIATQYIPTASFGVSGSIGGSWHF